MHHVSLSSMHAPLLDQEVDLPAESEELAGWFGSLLETEHAADKQFQSNFFEDFQNVLKKHPAVRHPSAVSCLFIQFSVRWLISLLFPIDDQQRNGVKIKKFSKCDFRPMFLYFEEEKAKKKAIPAAEKKAAKEKRDKEEEMFTFCDMDGRQEKVGNFRVEPPGLFRGRGKHPKKGRHKVGLLLALFPVELAYLLFGADLSPLLFFLRACLSVASTT